MIAQTNIEKDYAFTACGCRKNRYRSNVPPVPPSIPENETPPPPTGEPVIEPAPLPAPPPPNIEPVVPAPDPNLPPPPPPVV